MATVATLQNRISRVSTEFASLDAAVAALGASNAVLTLAPGDTKTLTDDLTIPANITLSGQMGVIATNGHTLTVEGDVPLVNFQMFDVSGGGQVVGLQRVSPRMFGADSSGSSDASPAMSAAALAAPVLDLGGPANVFRCDTTVTLPEGLRVVADSARVRAVAGASPFRVGGDGVEVQGVVFEMSAHTTDVGEHSDQCAIYASGHDHLRFRGIRMIGGTSTAARAGRYGLYVDDCEDLVIHECHAEFFTLWGFYVQGARYYTITDNVSIGHGFDGFKVSGVDAPADPTTHQQAIIANNRARLNARDGLDCAMNVADGILIQGNVFCDNTLKGIDLKNVYQEGDVRTILLSSNVLLDNADGALNVQGGVGDRPLLDVHIIGNTMRMVGLLGTNVRLMEVGGRMQGNTVIGGQIGVRVIATLTDAVRIGRSGSVGSASPPLVIKGNDVRECTYALQLESQGGGELDNVEWVDNDCPTVNGSMYRFKHIDDASNVGRVGGVIYGNRGISGSNQYSWNDVSTAAASVPQAGTIDVIYGAQRLGFTTSAPVSTRGTPGDYYEVAQPAAGGYSRFVATTRSGSATWKGAGLVQA